MSYREDLIKVATELNVDFHPNISTTKLEERVVDAGGVLPERVDEPQEEETAVKTIGEIVRDARKAAFAKKVVTVTNKDPVDANIATAAYASFQNEYFEVARAVPLDIPVELEQCLIDILESTTIILHKAEVIDGKATGNKVPTPVKKYVISYGV